MAVTWLQKIASKAPVPVFPAVGVDGGPAIRRLALTPGIELVHSPRHASILLVAGEVPAELLEALRRVHDQLPDPFTTVWFRCDPLPELKAATRIDDIDALADALRTAHRDLLQGQYPKSSRLLPDEPPNPWEGLGDDGHGGEGMMGGTPYGRPMAMNMHDDIRDGLTLDSLTFRLGPFFPALPDGMAAEVTLQGDLIQTWKTYLAPFPLACDPIFSAARRKPVPIAELELARARHHLQRLFAGLRLAGLDYASLQSLRLANALTPKSTLGNLRRRLARFGVFAFSLPGKGRLSESQARNAGGPAARAAGIDDDARMHDANYRQIGFAPLCRSEGDTRARWQQVLAEIEQSLHLARQAAEQNLYTREVGSVESPRGAWGDVPSKDASALLDDLLPGLEWDEALATVASLDVAAIAEPPGGGFQHRDAGGPQEPRP